MNKPSSIQISPKKDNHMLFVRILETHTCPGSEFKRSAFSTWKISTGGGPWGCKIQSQIASLFRLQSYIDLCLVVKYTLASSIHSDFEV